MGNISCGEIIISDREKFIAYRTIETFREYILIDQYRIYVEHYVKTAANQWLLSEYTDTDP